MKQSKASQQQLDAINAVLVNVSIDGNDPVELAPVVRPFPICIPSPSSSSLVSLDYVSPDPSPRPSKAPKASDGEERIARPVASGMQAALRPAACGGPMTFVSGWAKPVQMSCAMDVFAYAKQEFKFESDDEEMEEEEDDEDAAHLEEDHDDTVPIASLPLFPDVSFLGPEAYIYRERQRDEITIFNI